MDYVFGILGENEVVTTKGSAHSDLIGFQQVERNYEKEDVSDHFRVIKKDWSSEDSEGNCYDRYIIDRHYRIIDRIKSVEPSIAHVMANLDYMSMMLDVDLPNSDDREEMIDA